MEKLQKRLQSQLFEDESSTNKLIVKISCTNVAVTQVSAIINKVCNSKQNLGAAEYPMNAQVRWRNINYSIIN